MPEKFAEESKHLSLIIEALNNHLSELDKKIKFYEEEFKASKKYLWENR